MLQKKDYCAIAQILIRTDASQKTIDAFIDWLQEDNPIFEASKFVNYMNACIRHKEDL